jgi:hypothetical protein
LDLFFTRQLLWLVAPIGFTIADDAPRQPKGRSDPRESVLVGRNEPFLSRGQQDHLRNWWLEFKLGAKLPTWDLIVAANDVSSRSSLILVEAKAHSTELNASGKILIRRRT